MQILKAEAWTTDSWTGKRYKFAEAVDTAKESYISVQIYYDVTGKLVAAHKQQYLTVENAVETWLESDYEVLIKEVQLDDGRIIYQHWRSFGEPEARRVR